MALKAPEIRKEEVPEIAFGDFLRGLHSDWQQGQHITALGYTGGGKTTTLTQLLDPRKYVITLVTKRRDDLMPLMKRRGYRIIDSLDKRVSHEAHSKWVLHIPPTGLTKKDNVAQAEQITDALHRIWEEQGWTLYIDEIAELADLLGLSTELRAIWKEARSSKVSLVVGTQRPSRIPLEAYSQARFMLLWRSKDRNESKRLAEMNASDPEMVRQVVVQLAHHEILAVDTLTGELVRTSPPALKGAAHG